MEKALLRFSAILTTLVIVFLIGCGHETQGQVTETAEQRAILPYAPLPSRSISPIEAGIFEVVRLVDADTMIVGDSADATKQYRVRLIGCDAPERNEPLFTEATEFARRKIETANNRVRLSFDGEQLDRYRRTRAMVWLNIDGQEVWLNELLILEGLARARLDFRFSHEAKLAFALAEWEARENRRNLWKDMEE